MQNTCDLIMILQIDHQLKSFDESPFDDVDNYCDEYHSAPIQEIFGDNYASIIEEKDIYANSYTLEFLMNQTRKAHPKNIF